MKKALPLISPGAHHYVGACDGSAAVALGDEFVLTASDEDQTLRVYARRDTGPAVQTFAWSAALGLSAKDEADIEDLAAVGPRVFGITSHARTKKGQLERSRYRLFALDISGTEPPFTLSGAGFTSTLLDEMLVPARWTHPDPVVLTALADASRLDLKSAPNLAPKVDGVNVEGLARWPSAAHPGQLAIGFRNPTLGGRALLVTLDDGAAALGPNGATFGRAILLDLGGLSIRGMLSAGAGGIFILGGFKDEAGPSRLFRWSGDAAIAPVPIADFAAPTGATTEAIVASGSNALEIVFDQGTTPVGGHDCKDVPAAQRSFTSATVAF